MSEGRWLDPPKPKPHNCRNDLPAITWNDAGRRYECACGKVWKVSDLPDNQRAHLDGPGWSEEMPLELLQPEYDGECQLAPCGWWCSRSPTHAGPCALRPRLWNLTGMWRLLG